MQIVDEKSFKILIACENQVARNNLSSKLRMEGYSLEFADGGFHLLHLIEKHSDYNLIIISDNMHDMPAREMVTLIRTVRSKNILPIIYTSKIKDDDTVIEMTNFGVNDIFQVTSNYSPILERIKKYFVSQKSA